MAFGLASNNLEETIGNYTADKVEFYYSDVEFNADGSKKRIKVRTPLEIGNCSVVGFNYQNATETNTFGVNKLKCFKDKSYKLHGTFYSFNFSYIEIRVNKCQNHSTY